LTPFDPLLLLASAAVEAVVNRQLVIMTSDDLKKAAAYAAADLVADGMLVGLGSGSTLVHVLRRLGERVRDSGLRIVGVPTSYQARALAIECGIPIREAMDVSELDMALDGADEIDPAGNHLKGAGGAQVIEKIIASMARRYLVVADGSKWVEHLGRKHPVVAEVVTPALASAMRRFRELGGRPVMRTSGGKLGPVISDLGNPIVDVQFDGIDDPARLDAELNAIPGLVGHGLFVGLAAGAVIARADEAGATVEIVEF
jgi:ribose 5-phosphate isomerase A